jgi:hypothetical protein
MDPEIVAPEYFVKTIDRAVRMKHQITMCHKQAVRKICFRIYLVDSWRNIFLLVNRLRFHDGKLLTKALAATRSGRI